MNSYNLYMIAHKDIIQVIATNVIAISISVKEINDYLTTISMLLAIGFTIYKFKKDKK